MSRIGFYYAPENQQYSPRRLAQWLPRLRSLEAGWLVLKAAPAASIPERFLRGLAEGGIRPVIHLPCPVGEPAAVEALSTFRKYAEAGVTHVVAFDRPNMQSSWKEAQWNRGGLVERFLDLALPVLHAQQESGLRPTLPALEPGGDYWDLAFLEACLKAMVRRGQSDLLEDLTLAIYAWTFDRPLRWGEGGPARWPQSRPYYTPDGAQDHRGLFIFDWYAEISQRVLGRALPMMVVAGGTRPEDLAAFESEKHIQDHINVVEWLQDASFAPQVIAFNFYVHAAPEDHPAAHSAWFDARRRPRPQASRLQEDSSDGAKSAPEGSETGKPLSHYLLLPAEAAAWHHLWSDAAEYVGQHQPVVGFCPYEAALAKRVTLAGGPDVFPAELEADLHAQGCLVERLSLHTPWKESQRRGRRKSPGAQDFAPVGADDDHPAKSCCAQD